jgi:hypothetical protein
VHNLPQFLIGKLYSGTVGFRSFYSLKMSPLYMYLAPKLLHTFGARTFLNIITLHNNHDLTNNSFKFMMHDPYRRLHVQTPIINVALFYIYREAELLKCSERFDLLSKLIFTMII